MANNEQRRAKLRAAGLPEDLEGDVSNYIRGQARERKRHLLKGSPMPVAATEKEQAAPAEEKPAQQLTYSNAAIPLEVKAKIFRTIAAKKLGVSESSLAPLPETRGTHQHSIYRYIFWLLLHKRTNTTPGGLSTVLGRDRGTIRGGLKLAESALIDDTKLAHIVSEIEHDLESIGL